MRFPYGIVFIFLDFTNFCLRLLFSLDCGFGGQILPLVLSDGSGKLLAFLFQDRFGLGDLLLLLFENVSFSIRGSCLFLPSQLSFGKSGLRSLKIR